MYHYAEPDEFVTEVTCSRKARDHYHFIIKETPIDTPAPPPTPSPRPSHRNDAKMATRLWGMNTSAAVVANMF